MLNVATRTHKAVVEHRSFKPGASGFEAVEGDYVVTQGQLYLCSTRALRCAVRAAAEVEVYVVALDAYLPVTKQAILDATEGPPSSPAHAWGKEHVAHVTDEGVVRIG